jgi:GDPmannose 4,6-dehydratase
VTDSGSSGRRAVVTGLTGQDGSFLAELLLERGYEVIGLVRGASGEPLGAAEHLRGRVEVLSADLLEPDSLRGAVADTRPDDLYHLAAPSFTPETWRTPANTLAAIAEATAALLEAVRDQSAHTRVFVAVSGTIFGAASESPQREDTACRPQSPYAIAKLAAHQLVGQFRAHEGLFACSGILYNHESERRSEIFVSRKITRAAAAIKLGLCEELLLGDLDAVRDWSFAGDVMRGAWLMLQQDRPRDYVLASGIPHTVIELAELAFDRVGLNVHDYLDVDPALQRRPDPVPLVGDPARARELLGWRPTLSFEQLINRMVDADTSALRASSAEQR